MTQTTLDHELDGPRLGAQLLAVRNAMLTEAREGARWVTLRELEDLTGHPQASISARIRDLRKARNGGFDVARRRRPPPWGRGGTWEYRILHHGEPTA